MRTTIATETVRLIQQLEPREDIDVALRQMLENEVRRRLSSYELADRMFQRKYGMTLEGFEASGVLRQTRIYGDNDGKGWHRHPHSDPESHDFSKEGRRAITLTELLEEVQQILTEEGILSPPGQFSTP